ncbi:MAG: N-acetylmuramoyl-L-alanine amidase [Verrucomicrobia bacterium]|nr:N-acetylmuramoyl-L-alanine amidase [Verrucomicrobiota bacterium]
MKSICRLLPLCVLCLLSLDCQPIGPPGGKPDPWLQRQAKAPAGVPSRTPVATKQGGSVSAAALLREVHLKTDMVPRGTYGRKVVRPMTPRYLTIHSTENQSAGAERHALALKRGALRSAKRPGGNRIGYLIWHFTVDDGVAIQHMPTSEQGEHADFDGPGNRYSIGIEMCEQRGNNWQATLDRTAKLTAYLMLRHHIPLRNVVPHYHWPRHGKHPPNKNCPHLLLDHGRPGAKWQAFLRRVNSHYRRLTAPR